MRSSFALALLAFSLQARAQLDTPSAETPDADALFREGVEQLRGEHYGEAAAAFRESYRLDPNVTTMCNLALTYDRWGSEHREQAVRAYRTCAEDDSEGRFREHAADRAVELERELALEAASEPPPPPPPQIEPAVVPPFDHAPLWTALAPAGLAAGALAIAIGLALDAQATVGALMDELGTHPVIIRGSVEEQRLQDAETKSAWANGLYVTSAVLAAGAISLAIIDLILAEQPRGPITPHVAVHPQGASLGLAATF